MEENSTRSAEPSHRFLTPKTLGDLIHRPTSILAKWRLTGEGPPYIKLGRRVLYDAAEVEAWIAGHRRRSTSDLPGKARECGP